MECNPLRPLPLSETEWMFLGETFQVMLPLYEKTLLVSQTSPTIFQSTEVYWDLDDHLDEVIEIQGDWALVDPHIKEAVEAGRKALEEYTRKMDVETIIPYVAAVLDPRVKTYLISREESRILEKK